MNENRGKVCLFISYLAVSLVDVVVVPIEILVGIPSPFPPPRKHHMPPSSGEIFFGNMYDLLILSGFRFLLTLWFLVFFSKRKIGDLGVLGSSLTTVYVSLRTLIMQSTDLDTLFIHQVVIGSTLLFSWTQLGLYIAGLRLFGESFWQNFDLFTPPISLLEEQQPLLQNSDTTVNAPSGATLINVVESESGCSLSSETESFSSKSFQSTSAHNDFDKEGVNKRPGVKKSPFILSFTTLPTVFHPEEKKIMNRFVSYKQDKDASEACVRYIVSFEELQSTRYASLDCLGSLLPSEIMIVFQAHLYHFLENTNAEYVSVLINILKEGENAISRVTASSDTPLLITENLHVCEILIWRTVLIWYYDWELKTAFKLRKALKLLEQNLQKGLRVIGKGTSQSFFLQAVTCYGMLHWFFPMAPKATQAIILNARLPESISDAIKLEDEPFRCQPFFMHVVQHPSHPLAPLAMHLLLVRYDWVPQHTLLFGRHEWQAAIDWVSKLYWSTPSFRQVDCLLHVNLFAKPWSLAHNNKHLIQAAPVKNLPILSQVLTAFAALIMEDYAAAASFCEYLFKNGTGNDSSFGIISCYYLVLKRLSVRNFECSWPTAEELQSIHSLILRIPKNITTSKYSATDDEVAIKMRGTSLLKGIAIATKQEPIAQFGFDRLYDLSYGEIKLSVTFLLEVVYISGLWLRFSLSAVAPEDIETVERQHQSFCKLLQSDIDTEKLVGGKSMVSGYLILANMTLVRYARLYRSGIYDSSLLDKAREYVFAGYSCVPLLYGSQCLSSKFYIAHLIAHHGWIDKLENENKPTSTSQAIFELLNLVPRTSANCDVSIRQNIKAIIPQLDHVDHDFLMNSLTLAQCRSELIPLFYL